MTYRVHLFPWLALLPALFVASTPAPAVDLVKNGKPVATIVVAESDDPADEVAHRSDFDKLDDAAAAELLAAWVKKITDADLSIAAKRPATGPVIFVGEAAVKAGLKLDDIASPTKEGVRIKVDGDVVLIAGQSRVATVRAVARFLEHLGCRYLMDTPLGEVYPRAKTLRVDDMSLTEKPGLRYRNPKGPTWRPVLWKVWNGAGGTPFSHAHSWSKYVPKGLYAEHPEYFALRDGERRNGGWLCTSNPVRPQSVRRRRDRGDQEREHEPVDLPAGRPRVL